jgi:putative radical SAM enzyme (TIGR03279 family)
MVRIAEIAPGSIAEALELQIGSRIVRINGELVRDGIDFRFLEAEPVLEVEVQPPDGGDCVIYEVEKDAGEPFGVRLAPDPIRECANKCVFCFIDGNPKGARRTLWVRDDDFRLSFTYGSYVTLTNLGPRGFQRLIDQRLSPLYVSVHATEPEVRMRLLGVRRGGEIVEQLRRLTDSGIEVHTQVVLCPGWNDGVHLDRTIEDLWAIGPGVLSLSVVPVGLTRYNVGRPVRLLEPAEAVTALGQVERARERARATRGIGWAYAADELFLLAGAEIPDASYYDDWPLTENGVGAVRRLLDDFQRGLESAPRLDGRRIAIVTGTRMAPLLAGRTGALAQATGAHFEVVSVENRYFGPTVTTAGLLAGADIAADLAARPRHDAVLLPAEALNDDRRFVDDLPLAELARRLAPTAVVAGHELIATLGEL